MEICIVPPAEKPPVDRAYTVTMTIRNFKGRKDVDVHLFRPVDQATYDRENGAYPWHTLLDDPLNPNMDYDPLSARRVILEAFTVEERDQLVEYLKEASTYLSKEEGNRNHIALRHEDQRTSRRRQQASRGRRGIARAASRGRALSRASCPLLFSPTTERTASRRMRAI